MAVTNAYGVVSAQPSGSIADVYSVHTDELVHPDGDTLPNQATWSTSNGWIGKTQYSLASPSAAGNVGSFLSVLKTVAHYTVKALPTIIEIGLDVAEAQESPPRRQPQTYHTP